MTTAVVFAYHNVGVRCLAAVLAAGIDVRLVVTHRDNPDENIWFASVAALAARYRIDTLAPDDPADPALVARLTALRPDFLFSFYYRHMLPVSTLALATRGAFNMHGSLLPRYRGRVPVNWAILKGETETGATLHEMIAKPDAGRIVDQQAVPILPDDTAREVFDKVTVAAELVMVRALPPLMAGTAVLRPPDLAAGSYFGGRRPEDGRIDWRQSARAIHDLVRAVAPPYPGAFTQVAGHELRIHRTRVWPVAPRPLTGPALVATAEGLFAVTVDGGALEILELARDGAPFSPAQWAAELGAEPIPLA